MKKAFKWISFVLVTFLAIIISGIVFLPFFLPLEKVKDFAASKISETINREVKIEKVSFNLFSGIKLEKLSVGNRKGFAKKPFISADAIELRYAFWPIFKRQIMVKEISLVKPEILVEKSASGAFNFSDLMKKKERKGPAKAHKDKEGKEGFSLVVDAFSIRKGRMVYNDYGAKSSSEIKNADLTVSGITLALLKPIELKFSATAAYKEKEIPLSLAGKIGVDLGKEQLALPSFTLNIAGEKAALSANVSRWKTGPFVDFSLSSKKLSVDPLLAIFAGGPPKEKKKAKLGELTKKVNDAAAAIKPNYGIKGKINIENLSFKDFKIDKIDLSASLQRKQAELNLKEIALYDGTLSGKAKVDLAASGLAYNIKDLKLQGFNSTPFVNALVEAFLTKLPGYKDLLDKVYGRLSIDINLRGKGVEPQDVFANAIGDGSFSLSGGEIKRIKTLAAIGESIKSNTLKEDLKFKDLYAAFSLKNRVVSAHNLKLEDKDIKASFNGSADLANLAWVPGNRLVTRLSPAITKDLPKEFSILRDEKGWLELTFELTGSLKTPLPKPVLDQPVEKAIGKLKLKIEAKKMETEEKAKQVVEEEKKKAEEAAQEKVEEAKEQVKEKAKEKLKELIKF